MAWSWAGSPRATVAMDARTNHVVKEYVRETASSTSITATARDTLAGVGHEPHLMQRVLHAQRSRPGNNDNGPFEEVARRQDQSQTLLYQAIEPEQFQAVGMQLRECLLALMFTIQRRIELKPALARPKAADFWLS